MNSQARRTDEYLESIVPPDFTNAAHQATLFDRLNEVRGESVEASIGKPHRGRGRFLWAAGAVVAIVLIGLTVGRSVLRPQSVRAEVVVALENVRSFVMTADVYNVTSARGRD